MKTYHEMASDVFRRMDEYKIAKKKRAKKALITLTCLCFSALVIAGVWQSNADSPAQPVKDGNSPVSLESHGTTANTPIDSTEKFEPVIENRIVINQIAEIPAVDSALTIPLLEEDFVVLSKEDLTAYYETTVFPTVPGDLQEWPDSVYGIYKQSGGTGEVYWDKTVINYSNADFSRNVNIELQKGYLPLADTGDFYNICDKSTINGVETGIGQNEAGDYFVEFFCRGTSFRIIANGLSQDELTAVISSLTS